MEEFQHCPICLEVPEREIYQCIEGHIICHACLSKVSGDLCPHCRVLFGTPKTRSRILERILDDRHFVCKFSDKGCSHFCKREEITNHANSCSYNPDTLPLCEQLKLKDCNNFRIGCVSRSDVIAHFTDVHKLDLKHSPDVIITTSFLKQWWTRKRNVGETEEFTVRSYLAALVTPKNSDTSPLFLLYGRISKITGCLSYLCIKVWESKPPKKYQAQFVLNRTSTTPTPSISSSSLSMNEIDPFPIGGSMKVCSVKEARYFVNDSPINFKTSMLMRARYGYSLGDYIHVTIKEIPDVTPIPKCLEVYLRSMISVSSPPEAVTTPGNS